MNRVVLASALAVSLALPAAASAHPGVYTVTQKVFGATNTCRMPDESCLTTKTQYAVGNDGWANSFTEGNSAPAGRGLLNYKAMPGTWRGTDRAAVLSYAASHQAQGAVTDLQPHATCLNAAWDTQPNILAWQEDPFFNYIPWQKTSAGLGDEPSEWLPLVKQLTGVDLNALNTPAEFQAACTTAGGQYFPADVAASITTAQLAAATTPLQSQITTLQTGVSSLQAQLAAATAQIPPARPLVLTLNASKFQQGAAMITGPANATVVVRVTLSAKDAKQYKVGRSLMSRTVSTGAQGAALVNITPKAATAKKLKKAVKVTVEATAGGVTKTAAGTFTG